MSDSHNQIYPESLHEKQFVPPLGVPMSTVPMERPPKSRYKMQISGMVSTSIISLVSSLMLCNTIYKYLISFKSLYILTWAVIQATYWGLFLCFAMMAMTFPNYLNDENSTDSKKCWPIFTAVFIKMFWIFETLKAETSWQGIVFPFLGQAVILLYFHFCYAAGKDAWPYGDCFKPWIKCSYEPLDTV
jgi:hypothetical protein